MKLILQKYLIRMLLTFLYHQPHFLNSEKYFLVNKCNFLAAEVPWLFMVLGTQFVAKGRMCCLVLLGVLQTLDYLRVLETSQSQKLANISTCRRLEYGSQQRGCSLRLLDRIKVIYLGMGSVYLCFLKSTLASNTDSAVWDNQCRVPGSEYILWILGGIRAVLLGGGRCQYLDPGDIFGLQYRCCWV